MASPGTAELLAQRAWLHELAARLVRDEAERDDLVQETWLAALERPPRGDLRAWLAAILRNRWRFGRRTQARRQGRELAHGEAGHAPSAAELAEQAELQGVLVRAVLALEDPYRSTVLLRYFGGRSSAAIAAQEGVPEGTVRSRLKRALDQLRDDLDRANGGERRRWAVALVPLARMAPQGVGSAAIAWAAVAALLVLVLGWSVLRRGPQALSDSDIARAETDLREPDAESAVRPLERTALPAEPASTGSPAALVASGRMELLVLDPDSRPIPGARVSEDSDESRFELTTDERGVCRIPDEAWDSAWIDLWVDAPGFCGREHGLSRGEFSWRSPCAVFLPRAVPLRGRVLDAETRVPVAGATIGLMRAPYSRSLGSATTGADGTFLLAGAPEGWEVALTVRSADHALSYRWAQVSGAGAAPLEIELLPGVELLGSVVDAMTGAPLAGARAIFEPNSHEGRPGVGAVELARSDARGLLALRRGGGDEPDVLFTSSGYCSLRLDPSDEDFEVALLPTAAVEGVLRDADGRALAGAAVTLDGRARTTWPRALELEAGADSPFTRLPRDAALHVPEWRTETDAEGRFSIEVAPGLPGATLHVATAPQVLEPFILDAPLQPGETRRMDVTLPRSGTITGILRVNGEPSPGRVRCLRQGKLLFSAWTRVDGTFELHGIAPGSVALRACPDELHYAWHRVDADVDADLVTLEVAPGETVQAELELDLALGTIRGRVRGASGQPRAYVAVEAGERRKDGLWRTLTDAAGAFELEVPSDPPVHVLRVEGCEPVRARVGADAIELVSTGHGRLRLRAEDSSQRTLDRVSLFTRRAAGDWRGEGALSVGADGYGEWQLEAGPFELAVSKVEAGFPPLFLGTYTLSEGEDLELTVALSPVAETRFVLTNAPLPGVAGIRLERVDGLPRLESLMDIASVIPLRFRGGAASLSSLADGDYEVSTSSPDLRVEPARITLGADRSRPIELTWSSAR